MTRGVAGMPTAFTARHGTGRPTVALLLEYDALPDPDGSLLVVGTPAEEGGGGKIVEVAHGVFDDVDAALSDLADEVTLTVDAR